MTDSRREIVTLGICCAILLVTYLVSATHIGYDGAQYLTFAKNLLQTGSFTYDGVNPSCGRAPGYPAFIAGFLWAFGGLAAIYPFQLALLLASYWCILRCFAPYLYGLWIPALPLALTAIWPIHGLAMVLVSEPLFIAVTALSLLTLVRGCERQSYALVIAAGIGFGLSAYVRPMNVFATIILAGYLLARRHLNWRKAAAFAAAGLIVLAPWLARNAVKFHRIVPVAAHVGSFYYMTDPDAFWPVLLHSAGYSHRLPVYNEIVGDDLELSLEANDRYMERGLANIRRDPLGFVLRCTVKTVFVWSYLPGTKASYFSGPWLFALGIAAQWSFLLTVFLGWRQLRRKSPALADAIGGYALYTILALWPFYAEARFLIPVYIWLFGLAWYALYTYRETAAKVLKVFWKTKTFAD